MTQSFNDINDYIKDEDVKFLRLSFCDLQGKLKNMSVMASEAEKAYVKGVSFDGSAIKNFENPEKSDLFLFPDTSTATLIPWNPSRGKVLRLFCDIKRADGSAYELDMRKVLKDAVRFAEERGISCNFGSEFEFYLFKLDENGDRTNVPYDSAAYMDVSPEDKCENVRREICLTIEEMGLNPERSHHEEGPGQNEIDFKYSDPISSADHAVVFKNAAENVAYKNGLWADFSPKPLKNQSGSGMHVNVSVKTADGKDVFESFVAGVLEKTDEMTYFLNPTENSYERLGEMKAPKETFCGSENRNALIRIPSTGGEKRFELRSPDASANIYLVYALVIYAGVYGVENNLKLNKIKKSCLPNNLDQARKVAGKSKFIKSVLSGRVLKSFGL